MKKLLLFDVDNTICDSGQKITNEMTDYLTKLSYIYTLGIVGGGKYEKIVWQLDGCAHLFKYIFSENGIVSYKGDKKIFEYKMREKLGMDIITKINNYLLENATKNNLFVKTGNFITLRSGLIYYTPIGQECTTEERKLFVELDAKENIRMKIIKELEKKLEGFGVDIVLGGSIGIAVFPKGWSKDFCLQFLENENYEIYFFGDKIYPYGNDYEVAVDSRVKEFFDVKDINDTMKKLDKFL